MTKRETYKLPPGIYLIHWKSGGTSLAAIGIERNGDRWIAPCNWTLPGGGCCKEWRDVAMADLVLRSWERADKIDQALETQVRLAENYA